MRLADRSHEPWPQSTRNVMRSWGLGVLAAYLAACSAPGDSSPGSVVSVRDSSGIEIVEHSAAYLAALPVWTIDTLPIMRLHESEEEGFTDLGDVLALPDGRVLVTDRLQRDVREFAPDGSFARVFARNGAGPGEITFVSRLHDGRWLASTRPPHVEAQQFDGPIRRDPFAVTFIATDGVRIVLGTNEQYELREYDGARMRRIIRLDVPAEPAPADAGERAIAWSERMTSRYPADVQADLSAMRSNWRFATTKPFHERLHFGDDGTLWASAPTVLPTDARRYTVFDRNGHAIAHVELPPRVEPFRMSRERIVGTWTDADEVPHVMIWQLRSTP